MSYLPTKGNFLNSLEPVELDVCRCNPGDCNCNESNIELIVILGNGKMIKYKDKEGLYWL